MDSSQVSTVSTLPPSDGDGVLPPRARSDSLDIFTMSPLGSPSLDTVPSTQDSHAPPNMRLPEPPAFDLGPSVSAVNAPAHDRRRYTSPPSTPNSPTSFSFSPALRAYVLEETYGGTSYGTDMTSPVGSWSPGAEPHSVTDDEPAAAHAVDKGKAVLREPLAGLGSALETALVESGKGKGKGHPDDADDPQPPPFEFDFDFQQQQYRDGVLLDQSEPPVVRLSPGAHYRQFSQSSEASPGPSRLTSGQTSATTSAINVDPAPRLSPSEASSSQPSSDALTSDAGARSRLPTHRRSFSSLSIRSIRSSSSRSMASIRSGAAGIRGRVKAMAPSAKKFRGGIRKMFRRTKGKSYDTTENDDGESTDDEDERERELRHAFEEPMPPTVSGRSHVLEASTDSYMTVRAPPTASFAAHVADAFMEDRGGTLRSMSAPLPSPPLEEETQDVDMDTSPDANAQAVPAQPNRFNDMLPRELQLAVLRMLVAEHETEHARAERDDDPHATWTVRVAGRTRWVGRDKGVRELVKLTRVSKAWQALALDGQLWGTLHLASVPPHLPLALLLRLAEHAGPFVRSLDLRGWSHLDPTTLRALVRGLVHDTGAGSPAAPLPFPPTNLTHIALRSCTALTAHALHHVLLRAPALRSVDLHGLAAVTNTTCGVLAAYCPRLESADLRHCVNMDGEGLAELVGGDGRARARSWTGVEGVFDGAAAVAEGHRSCLRVLRAAGVRHVDEDVMTALAQGAPDLDVLDLSRARELTDAALAAFVAWNASWDAEAAAKAGEQGAPPRRTKVELSAREMGLDPAVHQGPFFKRVTRLRHLNISACLLLTDAACTHLAHCVPQLEFLELAGIGPDLKDDGIVRLLGTAPRLRRLDLEDACDITDAVADALGPALEHAVLSYALNVTNEALLTLMRRCTRLAVLECDNTRISGAAVREFVRLAQERGARGAEVVAVDCRAITEALVRELAGAGQTRARRGFRAFEARGLGFVDQRDGEGLDVDDCDPARVVLKSFWSWQGVDALRRERERRRRLVLAARRNPEAGDTFRRLGLVDDEEEEEEEFRADGAGSSSRPRWWVRTGGSGSWSPVSAGVGSDEDRGCIII